MAHQCIIFNFLYLLTNTRAEIDLFLQYFLTIEKNYWKCSLLGFKNDIIQNFVENSIFIYESYNFAYCGPTFKS
jgi:hypothetical protein